MKRKVWKSGSKVVVEIEVKEICNGYLRGVVKDVREEKAN